MLEEIKKAIEQNLPAQVGDVLKERLEYLDMLEKSVATKDSELVRLRRTEKAYIEIRDMAVENKSLRVELNLALRGAKEKSLVLDEREKWVERSNNQIVNIVQTVFGSNRLNYNVDVSGDIPVKDNSGYTTSEPVNLNGTVEKVDPPI